MSVASAGMVKRSAESVAEAASIRQATRVASHYGNPGPEVVANAIHSISIP
jgi:hypothetical protein